MKKRELTVKTLEHLRKLSGRYQSTFVAGMYIVFSLFLGALVLAFIATQFLGYKVATIQSYSMKPALDRGDLIVTRPTSIDNAKAGDIIVFEEGERTKLLVAHRVHQIIPVITNLTNRETGEVTTTESVVLRTKGDANELVDAQVVDASAFKGEVILVIPSLGLIIHDIPLQTVFFGVFVLAGLAWAAYEVVRRRRLSARLSPLS